MLTEEQIETLFDRVSNDDPQVHIRFARAIESAVRAELVAASPLTEEQCDEFRRLPGTFNDMVRAIYEAGRASQAAEYAHIRREVRNAALDDVADRAFDYLTLWAPLQHSKDFADSLRALKDQP